MRFIMKILRLLKIQSTQKSCQSRFETVPCLISVYFFHRIIIFTETKEICSHPHLGRFLGLHQTGGEGFFGDYFLQFQNAILTQ
jgi:hypothetical protein